MELELDIPDLPMSDPDKPKKGARTCYVVTKDGVACAYATQAECPVEARGVLVKAPSPRGFSSRKAANRAIDHTTTIAGKINSSLVFDWPKLRPITEAGKWAVTTLRKFIKEKHTK